MVLVGSSGATVTLENGGRYNAVGVVTSVFPSVGQAGTLVTINGTQLLGGGVSVASVQLLWLVWRWRRSADRAIRRLL